MELNPKLIQNSLELKYCQSKIIQHQHSQHLKKLKQIKDKSNFQKVKIQTQSLRSISENMNKYHVLSKEFKQQQNQQKRCHEDIKMIRSLSQIHQQKQKLQKVQVKENKNVENYKERKQNHNKLIKILKSKELQERNFKIGMRISRQESDFSYVQKIKKQIQEYTKIRKNMQRIKEEPLMLSRVKKNSQKKKVSALLTEADSIVLDQERRSKRARTQQKFNTEAEQSQNEEFLYEILRKNPYEILNQRPLNKSSDQGNLQISLPPIAKGRYDKSFEQKTSQDD